jgi:hypothetical protein
MLQRRFVTAETIFGFGHEDPIQHVGRRSDGTDDIGVGYADRR